MNTISRRVRFKTCIFSCEQNPGLHACTVLGSVLFLLQICTVAPALADTDEPVTMLITPNRLPTHVSAVGSSVSYLDAEDIEKRKATSVTEVLRSVPGVSLVQSGTRGGVVGVFMRGAESDQVLVLINGVRLNESTTGGFDFADLSVDNIERIEVLRGPQGVLYGSEAMGGVIHIITKKPLDGPILGAGIEAGSYDSHRERAKLGYGSKKLSTSTELSWEQSDGFSAAAADRGNSEDDSFELFNFSSSNAVRPLKGWELGANVQFLRSETEIDGFDFERGPVDDLNALQDRERTVLDTYLEGSIAEFIKPKVAVSYVDEHLEGKDEDDEFNRFDIYSELLSVQSSLSFRLAEDAVLLLGHVYEQRKGENVGSFDEQREVNAFFAQQQLAISALALSAGIRQEHDSDYGDETTYRFTAALPIEASATRLHASYGTGFKAPSFNELAFPDFGNPDLKPEESWGYDFGVEQEIGAAITADVTFFYTEYEDLITFDSDSLIAQNIAEARAYGFESTLFIELCESVDLDLRYTYTNSKDTASDAVLPRRARHVGGLAIHLEPIEKLRSTLELNLVNSRRDSDAARMDNYARVNAAVRYAVNEHIEPYIRVVNLFDEDYEEIPGYSTAGFSVFAGVDVELF